MVLTVCVYPNICPEGIQLKPCFQTWTFTKSHHDGHNVRAARDLIFGPSLMQPPTVID